MGINVWLIRLFLWLLKPNYGANIAIPWLCNKFVRLRNTIVQLEKGKTYRSGILAISYDSRLLKLSRLYSAILLLLYMLTALAYNRVFEKHIFKISDSKSTLAG